MIEFIKALPTIVRFLVEIKRLIDLEADRKKRKALLDEMREGIKEARKTGDTSKLESMFK